MIYTLICMCLFFVFHTVMQAEPTFLWDLNDSSVARQRKYLKLLLSLAGLQVCLLFSHTVSVPSVVCV